VGDLTELLFLDTDCAVEVVRRPSRFGLLFLETHSAAAAPPSSALAAIPSVPLASWTGDAQEQLATIGSALMCH
jgi:hypothetical protein